MHFSLSEPFRNHVIGVIHKPLSRLNSPLTSRYQIVRPACLFHPQLLKPGRRAWWMQLWWRKEIIKWCTKRAWPSSVAQHWPWYSSTATASRGKGLYCLTLLWGSYPSFSCGACVKSVSENLSKFKKFRNSPLGCKVKLAVSGLDQLDQSLVLQPQLVQDHISTHISLHWEITTDFRKSFDLLVAVCMCVLV